VILIAGGLGYVACYVIDKLRTDRATKEAHVIRSEAQQEAERIRREAEIASRDEVYRKREGFEKETQEIRHELRQFERRLSKREDALDRKVDLLNKKEHYIETLERTLATKRSDIEAKDAQLRDLLEQEKLTLQKVSSLSQEEAKKVVLGRVENEVQRECQDLVGKRVNEAKEVSEAKAREIIALAIQRTAADHTAESVVSTVELPNDEMKGRIIGREGRNIRAFERATGVDLIVDDTPGVVVVSGFDGVRREIARRAMERLVTDGRIHPARIEEVVANTKREVERLIEETGKQAAQDIGIPNLHPKEIELLGRLRFRTSYGQNALQHSIEVATLAAILAAELKLDIQLAKRCGLLHDIGKAVDQEQEGAHPAIGADLAKRFDERPEIINAISAHHEDAKPENLYTIITAAADAISASRRGARRESLEKYVKRLERLEAIATSYPGVDSAFAIQAGREIRVIVNPDKVSDKSAQQMARDIANQIQTELNYPGEVKVTVVRETRVIEYAR
jgi:ribonuclease Y